MTVSSTLTPKQISEILQVTEETVRDWLQTGKLPGTKVGGWLWRVKREDFEAFTKTEGHKEQEEGYHV